MRKVKALDQDNKKKKIAVLFGGCSSEYSISLQSAYAVVQHFNKERYEMLLIGITKQGEWYLYTGEAEKIAQDTWMNEKDCTPVVISPSRQLHGILLLEKNKIRRVSLDAVLPMLHGKNGEDGTVQGLLELSGIPLVGCGTLSSALCMNKKLAHTIVEACGVRVPKSFVIQKGFHFDQLKERVASLGYPVYVKPVKAGSSLGITKVKREEELYEAVQRAFLEDDEVILEENIEGFEVGCAVLGTKEPIIGAVDKIDLKQGFLDFNEKYGQRTATIQMPALLAPELIEKIKQTGLNVYQALGCCGFSRVDLFVTPQEELVFNEVNTIPGFTVHSRYPSMLQGIGLSMNEVLDTLIDSAFA
ncbi:D-alanine--D-serine ligase VanG [Sinanaerobacter sp. ZZT-01]|uniref:D-alanine--D-serine ligase VanG n=1 Tax=Sinanaerobacter sp. ZZT-01 TaxID=3111540 RepID=UPI002D78D929|nr:D-alanine--D-serine ligase VanG [Sinanaerobacter sp. ZZT-01]WRR94462.1 D-alanine--D-serine ligase VanG [Sinanaerobacter sp. ZZT-01]